MPSSQKPIVVVGSINIDLVASAESIPLAGETVRGSDFQIHPGGKGANQAVAISRLGYPVRLVGKVGNDVFGEQLRSYLRDAGVDIGAVEQQEGPSGVAMIAVSVQGENSIVVVPGANAYVTPDFVEANREVIRGAGIVLAQLEIPIETVEHLSNVCSEEKIPLMLDPAPAHALSRDLFSKLRWFTPNETEATFYARQFVHTMRDASPERIASALQAVGVRGMVLKMGSRGVYLSSSDSLPQMQPAFPVEVIDTTAAGDSFNGAFATALMLGMKEIEAARFASAAAAISVTRAGAQPSMPSRAEVEELLEAHL